MLAQNASARKLPNLTQINFDASHSQSHSPADTSHLLFSKTEKNSRNPFHNTSKIFPGDSAPNTTRTQLESKKEDLKSLEQKHALTKRRNSKTGAVVYDYHGPTNSHIQQLLDDLQKRTKRSWFKFSIISKLSKANQDFDNFLKRKLPVWLVEAKGPLAINADSIALFLLMMGTATYFAVRLENTEVNSGNQYYEVFNTIHNKGAIFSFVFTFYGLLFLSLSFRWVLTLLVIQSAILVFLSLASANLIFKDASSTSIDVEGLTIRAVIGLCGIFWTLAYPGYKVLRKYAGRFTSHFYVSVICIVIAGATIGLLILSFMTKDMTFETILHDNAVILMIFFGLLVSISWIVIHFKYFWVPNDSLEFTLKQIARKEAKKYTNKSISKPTLYTVPTYGADSESPSLLERLSDNIYWISSLIIGGCYITIEMFLAERTLQALQADNTRSLITAVFFFVSIPVFLIIGIPIGLSKGHFKDKSLVLPLVIMIPMFGAVPLSNMLGQWSDTVNLAWYLVFGPPAACLFWLAMAFFELKRRRAFYVIIMCSCMFFFMPFVLIGLSESALFADEKTWFFKMSIILIGIGVVVFGSVVTVTTLVKLYKFIKRKVEEAKEHKKFQRIEHEKRKSQIAIIEKEIMQQVDEIKEVEPDGFEACMNQVLARDDPESGVNTIRSDPNEREETIRFRGEAKENNKDGSSGEIATPVRSRFAKGGSDSGKKKRALWVNLIYVNLKGFGYWINAAAFIVSYTFVAYSLYNIANNATSNERGMLIGVAIVMPCIFLINNLLIRMKSTKFTPQERKIYLSKKELETKLFQDDLQNDSRLLRKATIIEICVLVIGILLIPALQVPLLYIMDSRQSRITNIVVMASSFLVCLFVGGLIELKKRSGPYHKFFVPAFVGLCWLFVVLPFFVAIPLISMVFATNESALEVLVKGSLTGSAFLIMIGVTALAIIINVFFQKLEEEKLIKFIVRYLQKILKENAVLAGDDVVRRLIEYYIRKAPINGIAAIKSELIDDSFPVVPIYPPRFVPVDRYGAKLLLYETHNRFLKAMAGGMLKAQFGFAKKKTLFERLAKCCADDHDEYDFDFDLNLDYMADAKDGVDFRVDDYLPDGIAQPHIKWQAILQEGATPRHLDLTFQDEPVQEAPRPKVSQQDADYKDAMTPKLSAIVLRTLAKEEARVFNRGGDFIRLQRDMMEMEMWYQHLYDYLSGRLKAIDDENKSLGLIYQNFAQFLRIGCINISKDLSDEIFVRNAKVKQQNISYLSYPDFIQAVYEIAVSLFPMKFGPKLLKAVTKQIFPQMMRIPDVARNYSLVATGFTKTSTTYEPQLEVFEKMISPIMPSALDNGLRRDSSMPESPGAGAGLGEGSFEIGSAGNVNVGTGTSWTANRQFRSQLRKVSRRHTGSIMQGAEDEISMPDLNATKHISVESRVNDIYVPVRASPTAASGPKNDVKLSKFGNAVASDENAKNDRVKFNQRRKRKSVMKKVGRNMLFKTAACCERVTKIYNYIVSKCVAFLTKISDIIYENTKGIGRALGFAIEEEHGHTDNDELAIEKLKKDAPAWPVLVDKIMKEIPRAEDLYFLKYYKQGLALMFNLANVCAILNKLEDFYSYAIVAFSPEIPWFSDTSVLEVLQSISWELDFLNFKSLFWASLGLVFVTVILSIPSIHYLRLGRLGEDKHGNKAEFPDPQYFLILIISILAGSSFCQIMKCILDAFVCDFETTPWTLQKDSSIVCLSDEHLIYMGIGALGIIAYYPISTFLYPNFQFQDKVLDLKYEPSFLVLSIQAKLVLTGFISFFKTSENGDASSIVTKLVGTMIILFLLALATLYLRPCLIKGMNLWEVAGYLGAAWANGTGLVVYFTGSSWLGIIMLISGFVVIFGTTLCVVKQFFRRKGAIKKKKRKVSPEQQQAEQSYVRYDSLKRTANVPEEVKKIEEMKLKKTEQEKGESEENRGYETRLKIVENPIRKSKISPGLLF